jgi:carbamoyltransferase
MKVLGIHCGKHNSSICLLKDGEVELFVEEERLSKIKYDSEPIKCLEEVGKHIRKVESVVVTHCGNSNFVKHLLSKNQISFDTFLVYNDIHHIAHAASGFYSSGFEEAICVVFDGRGSEFPLTNQKTGAETVSIFKASYPNNFKLIYKKLIVDPSRGENFQGVSSYIKDSEVEITTHIDIGGMYQAVANHQGFGNLDCGKTMGLSAYGSQNTLIPDLVVGPKKESNRNLFTNDNKVNVHTYPELISEKWDQVQKDLAYAVQNSTQEKALSYIVKGIKMSKSKNVVVSGGYALNIVANKYYKDKLSEINLFVDPLAGDGGLSYGASKLIYYSATKDLKIRKLENIYMGPKRTHRIENSSTKVDAHTVACLLNKGKTVAIFQGRSEAGARALGNRSILFNPCLTNGKEIINRIKKREKFRPFAGTILKEEAIKWFDIEENPFMTLNAKCFKSEKIPAIVHVDGTCRIQTLERKQNQKYYDLISAFFAITQVPILGNTSLNVDKQPIVETLSEAVETLRTTNIDYLYLPEEEKLLESG